MKPVEFITLENFLWAQILLVVIGGVYIFKKSKQPGARLRWRSKAGPRVLPDEMSRAPQMWNGPNIKSNRNSSGEGRSLNIHFMHNGHSWDAYEALGLPAGADLARAMAAHKSAIESNDPASKEFYDHALEAIRLHLKN